MAEEPVGRGTPYAVLSESDWTKLIRLLAREKARPQAVVARPDRQPDFPSLPEVYLARVPPGGIPPMGLGAGGGVVVPKPAPGGVVCNIYRLDRDERRIEAVNGLSRVVYNLGTVAIPGQVTVPVLRDKFGTWWATCSSCAPFLGETGTGTAVFTGTGTGTGTAQDILVSCCADTPLPQRIYLTLSDLPARTGTGTGTFTDCDTNFPYDHSADDGAAPPDALDYNCDALMPTGQLIVPLDYNASAVSGLGAWDSGYLAAGYNYNTAPGFDGYEVYLEFLVSCFGDIWGFNGHCFYRIDVTDFDPFPAGPFNPGVMLNPPNYYPRLYPIQTLPDSTNEPLITGSASVVCDPFYLDLGCIPLLFCCWSPFTPGVFGWHLVNGSISL